MKIQCKKYILKWKEVNNLKKNKNTFFKITKNYVQLHTYL